MIYRLVTEAMLDEDATLEQNLRRLIDRLGGRDDPEWLAREIAAYFEVVDIEPRPVIP